MRRWLAARYRRHAFSDEFEQRFDKIEKKFRENSEELQHASACGSVRLHDSGPDAMNSDEPYVLDIYL
jgi:hypothetical protein